MVGLLDSNRVVMDIAKDMGPVAQSSSPPWHGASGTSRRVQAVRQVNLCTDSRLVGSRVHRSGAPRGASLTLPADLS